MSKEQLSVYYSRPWTGGKKRSTLVQVTAPENLSGGAG